MKKIIDFTKTRVWVYPTHQQARFYLGEVGIKVRKLRGVAPRQIDPTTLKFLEGGSIKFVSREDVERLRGVTLDEYEFFNCSGFDTIEMRQALEHGKQRRTTKVTGTWYDEAVSIVSMEELTKTVEELQMKQLCTNLRPKQVWFNPPYTVVEWKDGVKTVVRCTKEDQFSEEVGLAMATLKRIWGNNHKGRMRYLKTIKRAKRQVKKEKKSMV